ncbi:MAG: PAS domain S-box protein, partial [SAR324 cluster bacterium]|nr:PAS domain S-box protein [SAR324 cluster bacterium]
AQDGKLKYFNPKTVELLGFAKNELSTKPFLDFIHPDHKEMVLDRHLRRLNGENFENIYSFKINTGSGQIKWVEIKPVMINWDNKPATLNFLSDITERKQTEDKLKESEKRFHDLVLCSIDWIWEVDKGGKYTYVSEKIENILGYRPDEIIGKTPFDLMPKEEAVRIEKIFKIFASEKKPFVDVENWNLTKDGKAVCLLTNGLPILDDEGRFLGYRGVDKDITAFKGTEKVD